MKDAQGREIQTGVVTQQGRVQYGNTGSIAVTTQRGSNYPELKPAFHWAEFLGILFLLLAASSMVWWPVVRRKRPGG